MEYKFFSYNSDQHSFDWQDAEKFYIDIPKGAGGAELYLTDTWKGERCFGLWLDW